MSARFSCLFVLAFTTTAAAEPWEVWEQDGTIWTRDLDGGEPWQISRGANCHSPDIDGSVAVWIADWSWTADVMGRDVAQNFPVDWAVAVQPEVASEPQVGYVGLPDEWAYFVWKQPDGLWGRRLRDLSPPPALIVPSYTGDFTLEGRTLTWDGGSMELDFPTAIPEPGTLVMLLIGLVCCVWHINCRTRLL